MKRFFWVFLAGWFLMFPAASYANNPGEKLIRGVVNVVTFPLEIPKQTYSEYKRGREKTFHVSVWILCGLVKGTAYSVGRAASGAWDMLTFPLAIPENYTPVMQPDYVF